MADVQRVLVTGGAGFIGSHLIRLLLKTPQNMVCNLDALTYAADPSRLSDVHSNSRYQFVQGSITDVEQVTSLLSRFQPGWIINLAAESHVDNSIHQSSAAIATNIVGAHVLLEASRHYWQALPQAAKQVFRFYQVSTDEVFGDFANTGAVANENSAYCPSSPYSASKAAADHLVRAWYRTYGLPVLISTAANNYGPGQHAEKLIPMVIKHALAGQKIGVYGDGSQERDWLYVEDHVAAIQTALNAGEVGQTYVVSTGKRATNLDVIHQICRLLDELSPGPQPYASLIQPVTDRPGHDHTYATDSTSMRRLGWQSHTSLPEGLRKTVSAYLRVL